MAPDCAPRPDSSLLPSYLYPTSKTAPALPRASAASALPSPRREPRQPPPHADGPRSRGKTNPPVKRPRADSTWARGWVSSSEDCSGHPRSCRSLNKGGVGCFSPLFAADRRLSGGSSLRRPRAPRFPGTPTAAGGKRPRARKKAPRSPEGAPPAWLLPGRARARPRRLRHPLPRWRGRAVRPRLWRRARLAGRRREVDGGPLQRARQLGTGEGTGGGQLRREVREPRGGTASPTSPCRGGRGRAVQGGGATRPERCGHRDVAVWCRRGCRPRQDARLWRWLPTLRLSSSVSLR